MKKKTKKKHPHHKGRRNAAAGGASIAPRPRASRPTRHAPPWKTIAAAVAGGAGGAALGGLVVHQKLLSEQAVGLGLMLGGGATAYFGDGLARVVGTGIAGAGAGQFALALMTNRAVKDESDKERDKSSHAAAPPPPQLPAAPASPPRKSATGGGVVLDLFRDAVTDLDSIEDEWRYGMREAPRDAAEPLEPIVIDLDEAA